MGSQFDFTGPLIQGRCIGFKHIGRPHTQAPTRKPLMLPQNSIELLKLPQEGKGPEHTRRTTFRDRLLELTQEEAWPLVQFRMGTERPNAPGAVTT